MTNCIIVLICTTVKIGMHDFGGGLAVKLSMFLSFLFVVIH